MNKIFDMNNGFWSVLGKIVDVFILHFIWFVCSIPIVTFGASTTALYYSMMKDVKDENPHYVKAFFKSFKENLKQGILLGLGVLVVGALLIFALYYYTKMGSDWNVIKMVTLGMLVLYVFVVEYIFGLLAKFANKTRSLLESAVFMSVKHIGWTLLMAAVTIGVYAIIIFLEFYPLLFLGYGLVAFVNSYMLNYIFDQYIPKEEEGNEEGIEADPTETDVMERLAWKTPILPDDSAEKSSGVNALGDAESTGVNALEDAESTGVNELKDTETKDSNQEGEKKDE